MAREGKWRFGGARQIQILSEDVDSDTDAVDGGDAARAERKPFLSRSASSLLPHITEAVRSQHLKLRQASASASARLSAQGSVSASASASAFAPPEHAKHAKHAEYMARARNENFRRPFKVSLCAGYLVLLFIVGLVFGSTCLSCWLVHALCRYVRSRHRDGLVVEGVPEEYRIYDRDLWWLGVLGTLLFYVFYVCYSRHKWVYYFQSMPHTKAPRGKESTGTIMGEPLPREVDVRERGEDLAVPMTMRPLSISWPGFLWCMHWIYPFFLLGAMTYITRQFLLRWAYRRGWFKKDDPHDALAEFMLETSTAFGWLKEIRMEASPCNNGDEAQVGVFSSEYFDPVMFPVVGASLKEFHSLEVHIDLYERRVIRTSLEGEAIPAEEAMLLVVYLMTWQGHAWLHSMAMWGADQDHPDYWMKTMSVCSLFFNHLGGDGGVQIWAECTEVNWDPLDYSSKIPFQRPSRDHRRFHGLLPYSRFVGYLEHARDAFFRQLEHEDYREKFSTMDPEGLFYMTIVHSLDHWMMNEIFKSPMRMAHFVYEGPERPAGSIDFERICFLCLLVMGLADDFPKAFKVYARQSCNPFFKELYDTCYEKDYELAWNMETCMIK